MNRIAAAKSGGKGRHVAYALKLALCAAITLIIVVPLYWMIVTSFKSESDVYSMPIQFLPKAPTTENYEYAFTQTRMPWYILNSMVYVIVTVIVVIAVASLAAYSISRYRHRGKKPFLFAVLFSQYMPITTLIVPLYIAFSALSLLNSRPAIIAIYCALQIPIAIWLLIGYFNGIPRALDEAATIDGCNSFQAFYKVVLPLARSGLIAVGISVAIAIWQELILAITFTNVDELRPLMAGVSATMTKSGIKWGQLAATGTISCLPIIVIYGLCQRYLVRGMTSGAVKG
ncbi:MAG: carbohydrate ABC transporter permease [Clostridiales Family XIII bacterium]|jgi:ABC-type glycerol-3-phosphate transport system permease component|nr:carbohydrate ABC transporter permease [Clostridiales Family XIII bacterium]